MQLLHPIRQDLQRLIGLLGIVRGKVHTEIVLAAHIPVHHELHGQGGLLTGIEDHRTDDRCRRSTPLDDFNVGLLREAQRLIADVSNLELDLDSLSQCHIAEIDFLLVDLQRRRAQQLTGQSDAESQQNP